MKLLPFPRPAEPSQESPAAEPRGTAQVDQSTQSLAKVFARAQTEIGLQGVRAAQDEAEAQTQAIEQARIETIHAETMLVRSRTWTTTLLAVVVCGGLGFSLTAAFMKGNLHAQRDAHRPQARARDGADDDRQAVVRRSRRGAVSSRTGGSDRDADRRRHSGGTGRKRRRVPAASSVTR